MPKWWMPDNGTAAVGIHDEDGKWLSDAAYRSHADALIAAHNADIDALAAERDELQRRIKSITETLTDLAGNPHAMLDAHEVLCVLAIAEGRTE